MSTEKPIVSNETFCISVFVAILCALVSLPILITVYQEKHRLVPFKNLTFTVESTAVKFNNLNSDSQLYSIVRLGIRAGNPDLDGRSLHFNNLIIEVRKGKHYKLSDSLPDFRLVPGSEELLHVDAVGMVRNDVAVGEDRVNVGLSGRLGKHEFNVTCQSFVIDSCPSEDLVQKVDCVVRVPSYSLDKYRRDSAEF